VSPRTDWSRAWPAPAKLNLFLHVVGRRADGYHLLQTAFRLIDLADTLRFSPRGDDEIRLAQALPGVPEDADLCVRAARLLQAETGARGGVTIALDKRIPMGGGLGGGSSDAATTLMALDALWGTRVPRADLSRLGLQLGADVPFFLFGRNALGEGIGEELHALDVPPAWYVVISPQVAVATKEIFSDPNLTRDTERRKIAVFFAAGFAGCRNDLEPVVRAKVAAVGEALDWLGAFAEARMSGSGSSVFAAFASGDEARRVASRVPGKWRAWAVQGLDRHPLFAPDE
jgi:4-diphosphocytidyl-2-C-methyl-D-erythritol kinase